MAKKTSLQRARGGARSRLAYTVALVALTTIAAPGSRAGARQDTIPPPISFQDVLDELLDPILARGPGVSVREALDGAAAAVAARCKGDPAAEAAARLGLGQAYASVAEHDGAQRELARAVELYESLLGPDHHATLEAVFALGNALAAKHAPEAPALLRRVVAGLPDDDLFALQARIALVNYVEVEEGPQAGIEFARSVAADCERVLGPGHDVTANAKHWLASSLVGLARFEESVAALEPALVALEQARGPDDPKVLILKSYLGGLLAIVDRADEGIGLLRDVLETRTRSVGERALSTQLARYDLAALLISKEHYPEGMEHYAAAVDVLRDEPGYSNPLALRIAEAYAQELMRAGRFQTAEEILRPAVPIARRSLPANDPDLLRATGALAAAYLADGRPVEAEPLLLRAIDGWNALTRRAAIDETSRLDAMDDLGACYNDQRRYVEAEDVLQRTRDAWVARRGPQAEGAIDAGCKLSHAHFAQGRYDEAEKLTVDVARKGLQYLGRNHPSTQIALRQMSALRDMRMEELAASRVSAGEAAPATLALTLRVAVMHDLLGDIERAETELSQGIGAALEGGSPGMVVDLMAAHARLLIQIGRTAEAEGALVEALGILDEAGDAGSERRTKVTELLDELGG